MKDLLTVHSAVFFLIGILSMLTHAVKKWAMGEIRGSVVDWYWMHPRATVLALIACIGGVTALVLNGTLTDYTVGSQILEAWGVGYIADTMNNQGSNDGR